MAGQIYKSERPTQEHIIQMLQRSKEVHLRQMEVLEMNGDISGGEFPYINLETYKEKRKRQAK